MNDNELAARIKELFRGLNENICDAEKRGMKVDINQKEYPGYGGQEPKTVFSIVITKEIKY